MAYELPSIFTSILNISRSLRVLTTLFFDMPKRIPLARNKNLTWPRRSFASSRNRSSTPAHSPSCSSRSRTTRRSSSVAVTTASYLLVSKLLIVIATWFWRTSRRCAKTIICRFISLDNNRRSSRVQLTVFNLYLCFPVTFLRCGPRFLRVARARKQSLWTRTGLSARCSCEAIRSFLVWFLPTIMPSWYNADKVNIKDASQIILC